MKATSNDRSTQRADAAVAKAIGAALQGNSASALAILAQVPDADFVGAAQDFRNCMFDRFGANHSSALALGDDPWIAALIQAYMTYWRSALTQADPIETAENSLAATIGQLIGRPIAAAAELDNAESEILAAVQRRGFHALHGRTMPLRELMLWRIQTTLERQVDLPGGRETVKVILLDDFALRGWGHYATCGRRSAGGWATEDALFAVVPAYENLDDEVFSVRFLGHEAQHLADKRAFPGLESWELEYRAKLVELSFATYSQHGTLELFCENRATSTSTPHGYANAKVIGDVAGRLGIDEAMLCSGAPLRAGTIRKSARDLLAEDTAKRHAAASGPRQSPDSLPDP
jgi:hypothetical protein